jgi:hypothetical protein
MQMAMSTYAIGTTAALLLSGVAPAEAAMSESGVQSASVEQRVAAIRAKAAQLSSLRLPDAAAASLERPAQVAWNDWKNQ